MSIITVNFTMARSPEKLGTDKLDAALGSLRETFSGHVYWDGNSRSTFFRLETPSGERGDIIDKTFHRAVSDQMRAQKVDLDGVLCRCTSNLPDLSLTGTN